MAAASGKYEETLRMIYAHDGSFRSSADNFYGIEAEIAWIYRQRLEYALRPFERLNQPQKTFRRFAHDQNPGKFVSAAADIHMVKMLYKFDKLQQPAFYTVADMAIQYGVEYAMKIMETSTEDLKTELGTKPKAYALQLNKHEYNQLMEQYLCANDQASAVASALKRNERRRKFIMHYVDTKMK